MEKKKKIIYFGNHPRKLVDQVFKKEIPSNAVYGLSRLVQSDHFNIEFISFVSLRKNNRLFIFLIKYFFTVLKLLYRADIVFSTQLVPVLIFRKLFFLSKAKWVHYNINLSYVLNRNRNKPIKRKLLLKAIANTDAIICLSKSQKELLLKYAIPENKLRIIQFGVDNKFYKASNKDKGYIFSVGRDMGRDYKTLINFAKNIKEKLIILAAPRNMENIKDIPENVDVYYNLPYLKMREFYENAKIIIIPSKRESYISEEPISDCSGQTVILESMACGKPVITSERSWIYDYGLENLLILYQAENVNDLLIKYNKLINNQDRRQEFGLAARKIINERYNINNMSKEFIRFFSTI